MKNTLPSTQRQFKTVENEINSDLKGDIDTVSSGGHSPHYKLWLEPDIDTIPSFGHSPYYKLWLEGDINILPSVDRSPLFATRTR